MIIIEQKFHVIYSSVISENVAADFNNSIYVTGDFFSFGENGEDFLMAEACRAYLGRNVFFFSLAQHPHPPPPPSPALPLHRGQTSEHAREIAWDCEGLHRLIRKTLHVAVTTAAPSCELEAKFSFYFNEGHRR